MNSAGTTAAATGESTTGRLADRVQSLRLPAPAARRQRPRFGVWLLVILLAGIATYTSLGGAIPGVPRLLAVAPVTAPESADAAAIDSDSGSTPNASPTKKPATAASAVKTSAAGTIVLESKGYIIPEQQILVSPQVSGRVIELNFDAGQAVTAGEVLAVLDSTEYRADHARAVAQVAAAQERLDETKRGNRPDEIRQSQAELAEAKTQLEQAQRALKRRRELFQQKVVTAQDLEDAESEVQALSQRVERLTASTQLIIDGPREERKRIAEAELRAAEAELARSQWRLDNTIISAPITGIILKKNAELGNLVNPVAFNGSFSLCELADLSKLEVELDIQERDISKVQRNQRCRIRSDAYPQRFYEGFVSRLMPIANRAKGVVPVRVKIAVPADEQGQFLKPEMGATVTFFAETIDPDALPAPPVLPESTAANR